MKQTILFLLLSLISIVISASTVIMTQQTLVPLPSLTSSNHIIYQRGDIPLILTVPHGGSRKNGVTIPDRSKNGDNLLLNDAYTVSTARSIADNIADFYGARPYMVICNVPRIKVDVNRPIEQGAESDRGRAVWEDYHQAVRHAVNEIRTRHSQQGLLLDIHGHRRHDFVMLGYLLEKDELIDLQNDTDRADQTVLRKSSIQTLAARISVPERPSDLLRGEGSFGQLMEFAAADDINNVVKTMPSPSHPAPTKDEFYFVGGYTTQIYHDSNNDEERRGGFDAIQIELPRQLRFISSQRQIAAKAIANAAIYWLDHYYQPVVYNKAQL